MKASNITSIVLAAGASTRMKSSKSKLLHEVLGKSLIQRSFGLISSLSDQMVFVVGKDSKAIRDELGSDAIVFAEQASPLGTADAVRVG
ncbi:MAG: NTP transferase domain-containing protein, partial [Bdellovibrionota bacterium]